MEGISKAVTEAIQSQLPVTVAAEMKQFIEQATEDSDSLRNVLAQNKQLKEIGQTSCTKIRELEGLKLEDSELKKRALTVEKRERELDKSLLEKDVEHYKDKYNAVQHLVDTVFRNPTLTYSTNGTKPVAVDGNGSCMGSVYHENYNETVTVENTK